MSGLKRFDRDGKGRPMGCELPHPGPKCHHKSRSSFFKRQSQHHRRQDSKTEVNISVNETLNPDDDDWSDDYEDYRIYPMPSDEFLVEYEKRLLAEFEPGSFITRGVQTWEDGCGGPDIGFAVHTKLEVLAAMEAMDRFDSWLIDQPIEQRRRLIATIAWDDETKETS